MESKEWHRQLGIPDRHGWLFEGPPGTGKTTTAMTLASHFDRPIYLLNLAVVQDDNALLAAFTTADPTSVLLVEDVDACNVSRERQTPVEVASLTLGTGPKEEVKPGGITLSGLLNAIDGVASTDGRLLIMTTNHPEKLDAALVRSNRVDRRWTFCPITPGRVREMVLRFFPSAEELAEEAMAAAERSRRTASDWQSLIVQSRRDPARLRQLVKEK